MDNKRRHELKTTAQIEGRIIYRKIRKRYGEEKTTNIIKSLWNEMFLGMRLKDVDKFISPLIQAYCISERDIPKAIRIYMNDEEIFRELGISFTSGLLTEIKEETL